MAPQRLVERVLVLEKQMNNLQDLPKRVNDVALQLSRSRAEMAAEFSAVRAEMAEGFDRLRAEIRDGDQETRRQMRVLHEDLVGRIALIQEGRPRPTGKRKDGR